LAIAALVPVVWSNSPLTNHNPFRQNYPEEGNYRLDGEHDYEQDSDQAVEDPEAVPTRSKEVNMFEMDVEMTQDQSSSNGADRPVSSGDCSDQHVDGQLHDIRKYEEVRLPLVEGSAEWCNCIAVGVFVLGTFTEADGLSPF